jgi:geranylgeranyl diphosphate synthase type II
VDFENRDDVKAEEYLEMIRLKTAVLLGCALKCGAWIGGAGEEDAQNLYDFGINIGLAFQLKDDLLDVYGDEATFGKKIGGDILCNKKTYMLIHALKLAKGNDAIELEKWLKISDENFSNDKILAVTSLYDKLGVRAICEEKMRDFYTKAVANLEKVSVFDNKKQELRKLAEKLMFRND